MCGIAGFSLRPESRINARELSHNLLNQIEYRGTMASGYAYSGPDGGIGYYKDPIRGSQLSLKALPRDAKAVILHTRMATHGTHLDNDNNHPVISPDESIALIHNGVIWNEQEVRWGALKEVKDLLPEVDSSVIPALLQGYGLDGLEEMAGDAAIAWLVKNQSNRLKLARLESSPVAYTWTMDGSFVFASTSQMLQEALIDSGLDYGAVFILDERVYFEVVDGVIINHLQTAKLATYDWSYSGWRKESYREITRGGHGSTEYYDDMGDPDYDEGEEGFNVYGVDGMWPGEKRAPRGFANVYHNDSATWEFEEGGDGVFYSDAEEAAANAFHRAMAFMKSEDANEYRPEYFTIDSDGDVSTYTTLENLEAALVWHAGLHTGEDHYGAEGNTRWIEHFIDIGTFEMDGTTMLSWIDQPEDVWNHETEALDTLAYVREGIGYLKASLGR